MFTSIDNYIPWHIIIENQYHPAKREKAETRTSSVKRRFREQANGESPARNESNEWTFEPQSEIYLIIREEYPRRAAPVIELEHKPNGRA
jgi:hypothetical protein